MRDERILERRLTAQIQRMGGFCIKLLPYVETGIPDRLVCLPGGFMCFVEFKAHDRKSDSWEDRMTQLDPRQRIWANRLLNLLIERRTIFNEKDYNCFLKRLEKL